MAGKKSRTKSPDESPADCTALVQETEAVKRLLVLFLIKLGVSSKELGTALGVDGSVIRRMMPSRKVKKFAFGTGSSEEE